MKVESPRVLAYSWLLLIHQLPAKPAYLRVKIWRRLQDIGAVAVKNAVHASSGCCGRSAKGAAKHSCAKPA